MRNPQFYVSDKRPMGVSRECLYDVHSTERQPYVTKKKPRADSNIPLWSAKMVNYSQQGVITTRTHRVYPPTVKSPDHAPASFYRIATGPNLSRMIKSETVEHSDEQRIPGHLLKLNARGLYLIFQHFVVGKLFHR